MIVHLPWILKGYRLIQDSADAGRERLHGDDYDRKWLGNSWITMGIPMGIPIDRWIYGGNFHRSLGLWRITYTITMYIGRSTCLLKVNDRCLTVGPKKATSPKRGPCENRAPQSWWFPSMILMNKSGWWFQPLWNIWVRQLGWLFPIYGNIKDVPNHQPVMIFEESIRMNLHLSDMPNIY
jgi:hypothetical protein